MRLHLTGTQGPPASMEDRAGTRWLELCHLDQDMAKLNPVAPTVINPINWTTTYFISISPHSRLRKSGIVRLEEANFHLLSSLPPLTPLSHFSSIRGTSDPVTVHPLRPVLATLPTKPAMNHCKPSHSCTVPIWLSHQLCSKTYS